MQMIRHPGVLRCHKVFDNTYEVSMVTEPVIPLSKVIVDLEIVEVIAGIQHVIMTIVFLHKKCGLSHNNLSLSSIFVGQYDSCWKIAGFENMSTFAEITKEKLMNESLAHARDVLQLGELICDIFELVEFSVDEISINQFLQRIQTDFVESSVEDRPEAQVLLNDEIFQMEYCQILLFLKSITIKTKEEKSSFFQTLHVRLHEVPPHVVAKRLLHLLLSRFVLLDPTAVEIFLPHLLTPQSSVDQNVHCNVQPILPEDLFKECCIPIVIKLFQVKDRHVRLILLKYIANYASMFEKDVLKLEILPQLRLGLIDSDNEMVSVTFNAMQHLVPLLGANIIVGGGRQSQFVERGLKIDGETKITSVVAQPTLLTSQVKSNVTFDGKKLEREKRKEESRRRNEERRKERERLKLERKAVVKGGFVEKKEAMESGDNIEPWEDFGLQATAEVYEEISDDSDTGRPSSSEISIDSGFSEKTRKINVKPPDLGVEERKESGFGMKIKKAAKTALDDKRIPLKDLVKLHKEKSNVEEDISKSSKSILKPKSSSLLSKSRNSATPNENNIGETKKEMKKEKLSAVRSNEKDFIEKNKIKDKPWEEFDMKIKTNNKNNVDDIFADMMPTLSDTRKIPVKGLSMYSQTLAVVDDDELKNVDGWEDDW
ncbi:protein-associating with the carboxyl-terminal domain of ezrin-like [Xenia sp. Carnegie-2017]|uniref:protein-associating with the carboxyl-terminal domain of ezrin-like n=1 Tax=Xenia sp. Carnegie-2017 TaxID=2897299 RepID=UPI001F04C565|nr:protein-associating with the carboxyl-terminal domain of ezrin-like [Xenia sp. Carnegie-2017]